MIENLRVSVAFEHRDAPNRRVELVGDFPTWKKPVRMNEVSPGLYRTTLQLAPGIYRYKFQIDFEHWVTDPMADAVDHAGGFGNGLRIVAGSTPPLFFAPDRRHVHRRRDGRITIFAEVADGGHIPDRLFVEAGGVRADEAVERVLHRNGRTLLRSDFRFDGRSSSLLGFAGYPAQIFPLPSPEPPIAERPAWAEGAVLYAIFVDRWHRGTGSPEDPRALPRDTLSTARTFYGGDLDGVREHLFELVDLGVTAVVLTPVHHSDTPHRYDAKDLRQIDPRLGGRPALERLIRDAHRVGLRVILDAAFTHVHMDHPFFQDLLEHQERSPYREWFKVLRFPVIPMDRRTYEHYYRAPWLPWLNLSDPEASAHVIEAARDLVKLGVDGLRLDAMDDAPDEFWASFRQELRNENPELLLFGEVVVDDLARYAGARGVDLGTDFQHRSAMLDFFGTGIIDAREMVARTTFQRHRFGPFETPFRVLFLDNHDTARFSSLVTDERRLRLALTYLLTHPEAVWLTYGTELALAAGASDHDFENVWPDRVPMEPVGPSTTRETVRDLCRLRKEHAALQGGRSRVIRAEGRLLILERTARAHPDDRILVCLNAGPDPVPLPVQGEPILSVNEARAVGPLNPFSARLFAQAPG